MKILKYLAIIAFTGVLLYASTDLPNRGGAENRMNQEKSITGTDVPGYYYIKNAYKQTHTPNIVTVVLGDYRSTDTLGEEVVIFTAGIICFMLLRVQRDDEEASS